MVEMLRKFWGYNPQNLNPSTFSTINPKHPQTTSTNPNISGVDRKSNRYRLEFNSFAAVKIVSYLVSKLVPG